MMAVKGWDREEGGRGGGAEGEERREALDGLRLRGVGWEGYHDQIAVLWYNSRIDHGQWRS